MLDVLVNEGVIIGACRVDFRRILIFVQKRGIF